MVPWILWALLVSADSSPGDIAPGGRAQSAPSVQSPNLVHVRSTDARLRAHIADGYARSPTFRAVVDAVDGLQCLVYVAPAVKLSDGMRGAFLHGSAGAADMPMLRVLILASLSSDETIAVIGHELQHVAEAIRGAPQGGAGAITEVFAALDSREPGRGAHKYETEAAVAVTAAIVAELHRTR